VSRRRRALRIALVLLSAGLLVLIAVVERYDPYLLLFLGDLWPPKPAPLSTALNERVSLTLYSDARPHVGKIASLQKGLVLVYEDQPLIEEGFGFGAPIIQVGDVAHLSRHASTALVQDERDVVWVKTFTIDVADRPTRLLRVKYPDVPSLGTVVFSYTLRGPETITVDVDFGGVEVAWDRAYLMNEQGAISFPAYQDAQGQVHDQVGRWSAMADPVGCWLHKDGALRFCVETEPGRRKFVGRERYNQYRWTGTFYLSWSGVDVEIAPPQRRYRYWVHVETVP
jgi:hypothetical protein